MIEKVMGCRDLIETGGGLKQEMGDGDLHRNVMGRGDLIETGNRRWRFDQIRRINRK